MDYIKIYRAENSYEAHFIKGLLNKYSIDSRLLGENLSIVIGELPIDALQVDILVPNNRISIAKKILDEYKNNFSSNVSNKEWQCSKCSVNIPKSFEICWNCK